MKTIFLYFSIACSLLVSMPCLAQTLWQGTTYGMTVNEVQALLPAAASPESKPRHLASGGEELLRITNVDLVNERFVASFFFIEGRLSQVTLSLEKGRPFSSAMLAFQSLTEALRAKYGAELSRDSRSGSLKSANAEWLSGRTNISLIALGVGNTDAVLNVNYQVRIAREADKL